jgi:LmbE family N-acetylglucosaminyl deacetylase
VKTLLAVLLAGVFAVIGCAPAQATINPNPAIYFVPHQDDESLTMAADIRAHVKAGRKVILVMVTKGDATGAWKPTMPLCATYHVCLDSAGVIAARNREFIAAAARLGVPKADIRWAGLQDGVLTFAQAGTLIGQYVRAYPGASFKTMSWLDDHPDHRALGEALRYICKTKHMIAGDDCRFEQFSRYWVTKPIAGGFVAPDDQVTAALNEYLLWDPDNGRYAIGGKFSVPGDFTRELGDPLQRRTKWHVG